MYSIICLLVLTVNEHYINPFSVYIYVHEIYNSYEYSIKSAVFPFYENILLKDL